MNDTIGDTYIDPTNHDTRKTIVAVSDHACLLGYSTSEFGDGLAWSYELRTKEPSFKVLADRKLIIGDQDNHLLLDQMLHLIDQLLYEAFGNLEKEKKEIDDQMDQLAGDLASL